MEITIITITMEIITIIIIIIIIIIKMDIMQIIFHILITTPIFKINKETCFTRIAHIQFHTQEKTKQHSKAKLKVKQI